MGEYPTVEAGPAHNATTAQLHVDQIPRILAQRPRALEIKRGVKVAVPRAVQRLYGGEIHTHDKGVGILLGNVNGPDSRAATQVEETTVAGVWRIDQCVGNPCYRDDLMEDVQAILLQVVTG